MGKVEHHECDSGSKLSFHRGPTKFFKCWCSVFIFPTVGVLAANFETIVNYFNIFGDSALKRPTKV